jgi:acyl carrier protein
MFPISKFLGDLTVFMIHKVAGKVVETTIDQRKKACAEFLKLRETLQEINQWSGSLANTIDILRESSIQDRYISPSWPFAFIEKSNRLTEEFLNQYPNLSEVLLIYDPHLAALLSGIKNVKKSFILTMKTFALSDENSLFCDAYWSDFNNLIIKLPKIEDVDFDELETEYLKTAPILRSRRKTSNMKPFLANIRAFRNSADVQEINSRDISALGDLCDSIRDHEARTALAVESLTQFIQVNFSLDDLLSDSFQSRIITFPKINRPCWKPPYRPEIPSHFLETPVFTRIADILAEQLFVDLNQIDLNTSLYDLGADSLDSVEIIMSVEEEFEVEISDDIAEQLTTVNDFLAFLIDYQENKNKT